MSEWVRRLSECSGMMEWQSCRLRARNDVSQFLISESEQKFWCQDFLTPPLQYFCIRINPAPFMSYSLIPFFFAPFPFPLLLSSVFRMVSPKIGQRVRWRTVPMCQAGVGWVWGGAIAHCGVQEAPTCVKVPWGLCRTSRSVHSGFPRNLGFPRAASSGILCRRSPTLPLSPGSLQTHTHPHTG